VESISKFDQGRSSQRKWHVASSRVEYGLRKSFGTVDFLALDGLKGPNTGWGGEGTLRLCNALRLTVGWDVEALLFLE
jgi:hypothetical protein